MDRSRRGLLRAVGASLAAGSLLGRGSRPARAHADVADQYRWAPESNYEYATRSADDVRWLVLHTIEGSYESGLGWLLNPDSDVSSHFVVGNEPDQITQMVHCDDVAWAQGNGAYNDTGVSIELEGVADETEFDDTVYRQAAAVARWVCEQYDVPMRHPTFDLAPCDAYDGTGGIIGHEQVPSPDDCSRVVGGKYDPGDTWDWEKFMRFVRNEACTGDVVTVSDEGTLSATGDRSVHSHDLRTRGTCRASVSLSGPGDADFDLYLTLDGRTPSAWDHDRASQGTTSEERIVLEGEAIDPGATLGIAVESYDGSGEYTLSVSETGSHRFEDDQWVRTTADGWGYQYPRDGAPRLDRLSEYTHGRIVNGPTRNDGQVWWGLHLVNERLWAWIPGERLTAAPGGPRHTLGDRVYTTTDTDVHARADEDAPVVDRKSRYSYGEIVNSADREDGDVWWAVRFDDGTVAWCPQSDLHG